MIMNHQPTGVDHSHCSLEAELLQHQMNTLGLRTLATHSQPHLQPIPSGKRRRVLGLEGQGSEASTRKKIGGFNGNLTIKHGEIS
jgi:hypothetical protein